MKRRNQIFAALCVLTVACPWTASAQANGVDRQATAPFVPPNPLKVALLHWYPANTNTSFAVGNQPYGVCFDGANIWVANYGGASVTKLRAADGAVLGTFTVPLGPYGCAFDGANVWVTGSVDGNVTKLRASDGKNLGTFTVGTLPFWLAFDGANIWVANSNNTVTKLRATDGKNLGTFAVGGGVRWRQRLDNQLRRRHGEQTACVRWEGDGNIHRRLPTVGCCLRRFQHVDSKP